MSSGRQHDSITWLLLPIVAVTSYWTTKIWLLSILVSISFVFSGLMFGPDLDIRSIQYARWGILRFFWTPYQKVIPHRSFLSHGFLIGTIIRICYLLSILVIISILILLAYSFVSKNEYNSRQLIDQALDFSFRQHPQEIIASLIGLEVGAMSHYVADWISSNYKKLNKSKRKKHSR